MLFNIPLSIFLFFTAVRSQFYVDTASPQVLSHFRVVLGSSNKDEPDATKQLMPSINVEIVESVVIAMYSYNAKHGGDLSFRKGEKLEIVEKNDPDWWTVKRLETGEVGYIPSNYVGTTALESEE